jgi:site-specific DNA recombinase
MICTTKALATPKLRCAIYTRKSTDDGLEKEFNSLDAQREAGEAYIASQKHEGWLSASAQYDDGGFTGANMDRPALRRLLQDIEAGEVDVVVVYKVDRLSRSLLDFARIMEVFDRHNVAFVSVTQAFNTATSMGRLVLNILLSFAQFEREMISERTRDKMSAARRKGKWLGGIPVLGYTVENSKLVIDPDEAVRVKEIFELYLDLKSTVRLAHELNKRGWRNKFWTTKSGKQCGGQEFTKNSVSNLLTNTTYVGKVQYKTETHPGEHSAIVDLETFNRVQTIMKQNAGSRGKIKQGKHNALLQGLLRCANCDCAMSHSYSKKGPKLYRYYVCQKAQKNGWDACPSPSLPAHEIEKFVVDQIRVIGQDPGFICDTLAQVGVQMHQREESIKQEKRALERDKSGNELQRERRLKDVQRELSQLGGLVIEDAEVQETLSTFGGLWDELSPNERIKLVGQLVEQITYDGRASDLSITYHQHGIQIG